MSYFFSGAAPNGARSAEMIATVDNLFRKRGDGIQKFRTDEGPDWKSKAVRTVVEDRSIVHTFTLVGGHGEISIVERRFRFTQENALASLRRSGYGPKYLFLAIQAFNFIQNHLVRGDVTF